MFKNTYGFTFLVVLGAVFLTGPQSASVANESASAPAVVHVAQSAGGVLG
jgi:hypothetical protein